MAYELQYYGMRFIGIQTAQFDQTPFRDPSDTDIWFDKFTVGVSTIINTAVFAAANQNIGVIGNRVQGATAADICRNLQSRMEDRKQFALIQNGVTVLEANAATDADNGPKVRRANFKPMGANSIKVDIVVECCKISCSESPSAVVNNRWEVSDDIDDNWRTTRRWRGKLRLSNAVYNPQAFRHLVVPLLSDGFQRVKMHFTGELNALELGYEVVDQQLLGDAPPQPAINMQGTHTETLNQNGASSIGEVYVRLDGPPGTDKQVLLENCMRVINSKVQADRFRNNDNWRWLELIVTDYLGPNVCTVDARARVQRAIPEGDSGGGSMHLGNMLLETFARPLDLGGNYSRFQMLPPALYPCTTIGLFAAHLQSPCEDDHAMPQVANTIDAGSESPGTATTEQTPVTYDPTGTPLEIDSPGYNTDQTTSMYTHANVEWIIQDNEGYVQMPVGDQSPGSVDTAVNIRLHASTAKAILKMSVERLGEYPKIPRKARFTDSGGIKYVPLSYVPNFRPPEYQGDGRKMHVVDVEAVFAMSRAPGDADYVVPSLPWDDLSPSQVPSSTFVGLQET